jgi:hypothetical protein
LNRGTAKGPSGRNDRGTILLRRPIGSDPMTTPILRPLAIALLSLAEPGRPPSAQEPGKSDDAEKGSGWLPILKRQAAEYEIIPRGGDGRPLGPPAEPILRWTQPVRGGDDGAVFLWTLDGRPEVVGTIFTWRASKHRVMQHEVHSLAPTGLDAAW